MIPLLLLLLLQAHEADSTPAVERLRNLDPAVRRAAEKELSDEGARAAPSLRRALAREGDPVEPRVDALVRGLGSSSWKEREEATRSLVRLGRAARARLQTHENATDVEVAWRVKAILAELKELESAETTAYAHADAAICRLLGAAGDAPSVPLILEAVKRADQAPAEAGLDLRLSALGALADLRASLDEAQAAAAVEEGVKLLKEPRRTASAALRSLGRLKSAAAVAPIAALLGDASIRDLHLKRVALATLAAIDHPESTRVVVTAASSADPYVGEAARQALASLGAPVGEPAVELRAWWEKKHGRPW